MEGEAVARSPIGLRLGGRQVGVSVRVQLFGLLDLPTEVVCPLRLLQEEFLDNLGVYSWCSSPPCMVLKAQAAQGFVNVPERSLKLILGELGVEGSAAGPVSHGLVCDAGRRAEHNP